MDKNYVIKQIIDIHSHILPGVDDGSDNMDETLAMLRIAEDEGITHIIATPHYKDGRRNPSIETLEKKLQDVREQIKKEKLGIDISLGTEIRFFRGMEEELEHNRILTMNGTDAVLVEFMPDVEYPRIRDAMYTIRGEGYSPILAHIERYECMVKHPEYAQEIKSIGVEIQVNAASIVGKLGFRTKRYVIGLLSRQLVDYVATDCHDSKRRKPEMKKCVKILKKKCDKSYVKAILYKNAKKLIGEGQQS